MRPTEGAPVFSKGVWLDADRPDNEKDGDEDGKKDCPKNTVLQSPAHKYHENSANQHTQKKRKKEKKRKSAKAGRINNARTVPEWLWIMTGGC